MSDKNMTTETQAKSGSARFAHRLRVVEALVTDTLSALGKPCEHTELFYEIYPEHAEGPEAKMKWHDIGRALTTLVSEGKVVSNKPEGKRRTTFALVREG